MDLLELVMGDTSSAEGPYTHTFRVPEGRLLTAAGHPPALPVRISDAVDDFGRMIALDADGNRCFFSV